MAGRMIPVGRLAVATPASMALAIRNTTEAQVAVDERVTEVAAGIIAADPTVAQAAADAVGVALSEEAIARGEYVGGDRFSVRFENEDGSLGPEFFQADEVRGIFGTRIQHLAESVPTAALSKRAQQSVSRLEILDPSLPFTYLEMTEDRRLIWGQMTNGRIVGTPPWQSTTDGKVRRWIALGDSTTWAINDTVSEAQRWSNRLASAAGIQIENYGRAGGRSAPIAWLYGALDVTGSVVGGTIPAAGTVLLDGFDHDPYANGTNSNPQVVGVADDGTVIKGTFTRISTGDGGTARQLTVTSTSTGAAVTSSKITLRAVQGWEDLGLFLAYGINDEDNIVNGVTTIDQLKAWYTAVTSRHRGPLVVWGMLDRGLSEQAGTPRGDIIREMEPWWAVTYGDGWFPARKMLSLPQALIDAKLFDPNFTPTAEDEACVAAGVTPPSFRLAANDVHPNVLGNWLMYFYFFRKFILRGLI